MMSIYRILRIIVWEFSAFAQIGLSETLLLDTSRDRQIPVRMLYPSDNTALTRYAENIAFYGFSASSGELAQTTRKLPLYILVHGTSGNWKNLSWLASELAKDGIVVSANHPDYTTGQASPASVLRPWNQAKDVSFIISHMLGSAYSDNIDEQKIVVIGHSLGGYSALALSGAELNLRQYVEFCGRESDKSCTYFKNALGQLTEQDHLMAKQSLTDSRISANIALAPGFVESFTPASLLQLVSPTLIIGAQYDENVPPSTHFANLPNNIQYHLMNSASHFSFLQRCKPQALEILAEEDAEFVCLDGGERTRESIHQETLETIRAFLLQASKE